MLGHDAFEARHGLTFDMFINVSTQDNKRNCAVQSIENALVESKTLPENDMLVDSNQYLFIGNYNDICDEAELGYYVKTPEVIYSLAAMIPSIIKYYPVLSKLKFNKLEQMLKQKACIWTFCGDCHCCG